MPEPNSDPTAPGSDRLDSWKEIAAHLKRDVSTVQRWEKREGLPVHRHLHDKLGSVYASRKELDAWWNAGRQRLDAVETPRDRGTRAGAADRDAERGNRHALVRRGTLIGIGVLAAVAFVAWRGLFPDAIHPTFTNLVQVTTAIGVEDYPTWSPDGGMLAYEGDQSGNWDVWVTQPGGGPAVNRTADHVGPDRFPSWSPDGRQIAFWSARDGGGCFVIPALAGAARKIVSTGLLNSSPPRWSADGMQLACIVGEHPHVEVVIVTLADGSTRRVGLPGEGRRFDLSWSADQRLFAYIASPAGMNSDVTQLWIARSIDGTGAAVTDGRTNARGPAWSHDGRSVYYLSNAGGAMDLWSQLLDSDGKSTHPPQRLTTGTDIQHLALSPNGARIASSKGRRVANVWRVPILADRPATWSDAVQITFDQAFTEFVDVSPDRRQLAISSDRSGNQDLWTKRMDGGDLDQLTNDPAPDWCPRWSPDGRHIVFYSFRTGNRDLWLMSSGGGSARQLTSDPRPDLTASWSPDGRQLAFVSGHSGAGQLWVMPLAGGEGHALTSEFQIDQPADWSPDGKWVMFSGTRTSPPVGLWAIPVGGGPARRVGDGPGDTPRWSTDGTQVFFVGVGEREGNLWSVSWPDGRERPVTQLAGRRGHLVVSTPATDGSHLFFSWEEDLGDLWIMDIVGGKRR